MVVTDLPFSRTEGITSRYDFLKSSQGAHGGAEANGDQGDSQQYAAFLK